MEEFYKKYNIIKKINEGAQGMIMLGKNINNNKQVAIKIINNKKYNSEIEMLKYINKNTNKNILKIYEYFIINNKTYIITEYINGIDLFDFIIEKNITIQNILNITTELILSLKYLKENKIIHCDLKPENIMMNKYNRPILIDFGSAIFNNDFNNSVKTYTYCYQPPEFFNDNIISYSTDVWALGCILYSLITRQHPFDLKNNKTKEEVLYSIRYDFIKFNQPIWLIIPSPLQIVINRMLNKHVNNRISIEEVYTQLKNSNLLNI